MPVRRRTIEHLLEHELGFQREEGDHHYFRLEIDSKLVARTKTSHSHDTLGDDLLALMARQLYIPPRFLKELLAGRKTRQDYLEHLRRSGRF